MKYIKKDPKLLVGTIIIVLVSLMAIFAPLIAPYSPTKGNLVECYQSPSLKHPLGTDSMGRDLFSRIVFGARVSLAIGLVIQFLSSILGITLGTVGGYFGKFIDDIIVNLNNLMLAFPRILFALAIMATLGPGLINVFIALGVVSWTTTCRIARSSALSVKEEEYVEAARAVGNSNVRIIVRHVLPNTLGPLIVIATLGVAYAIIAEATLSFLGLGVQPPTPSWGAMLSSGRKFIYYAPWISTFPGLAIVATILGLNFLGDGLRDILDPHSRTEGQM
ncbi:ABC transporter permease [Candidatus Bipolaricaulota bacterium]|nr:ABC transporter permease [Candidatus Bipolaricaulota bacterium]